MQINSASYWRKNKNWNNFIGKVGQVVFATKVEVTSPELQKYLPYSFAIVEIDGERYEFMSIKDENLKKGDSVRCVFRKISDSGGRGLIDYGVKLLKVV